MKGLKILSLFDGISCGMVALERAGIPVERYVAYEIEKNAIKISKKNYPKIEQCGDVFKANFAQYKGFDLLIGGSPCTFWSVAKKDRETSSDGFGFELFKQYVRAFKESGCKYFLYENNFSMHKDIKEEITKYLGVEPIMINSDLVSAQNRKRLYWTNIPNVTQPKDKGITLQRIIESGNVDRKKSLCITRRYAGFSGSQSYMCRRYFGKSFGQAVFEGDIEGIKNLWKQNPYFDSSEINIRQLSITECERLQTLPDGYTNVHGVNSQMRYESIGNGWTVDVIAHILSNLKEHTEKENKKMELIMNEVKIPEQITFNYEDIKREVQEKAKEYSVTVYTPEQITEAKKDKATLNKLKKALNDERIRQERAYMQPFNDFKNKINELIKIIDEPVQLIDKQVKEYEENEKAEKRQKITEYWESKEKPFEIPIEKVFEEKWLNKSVSMKSIEGAIDVFVESTEKDLETLAKLPEFAFEALEVYKTTLDINNALNEGRRLADIQKRKREHEAELARKKAEEREMVKGLDGTVYAQDGDKQGFIGCASEQLPGQIGFADAKSFEECMNPPVEEKQEEVKRQWVAFKANLTTEDAKALKAFFDSRNIEFKPI